LFKTAHDPSLRNPEAVKYDPNDFSRYQSLELRASVFLTLRLQALTVVPFVQNSVRIAGYSGEFKGIGAPTLLASYALVQRDSSSVAWQWLL